MRKKVSDQLALPLDYQVRYYTSPVQLSDLLNEDLDFSQQESGYASHQIHSFPAKFPPQLPRKFIETLTLPGEVVLDPMQGSGTTVLEAALTGRRGIGADIDPLALLISRVKTTALDPDKALAKGREILHQAANSLEREKPVLEEELSNRWDLETRQFLDQWFLHQTQIELLALLKPINQIAEKNFRDFFRLVFSSIIITKSGGVSLALDLAHTRPHRAKVVFAKNGKVLIGEENENSGYSRNQHTTKTLRTTVEEFEKRLRQNLKAIAGLPACTYRPEIIMSNAQATPLPAASVDLIVTSPPYASNAIDYMRAHKFTLVWLGYPIHQLSRKRNEYIGGESAIGFAFEAMPEYTHQVIAEVAQLDAKKGLALHRYYSEMSRVIREMYRVLKPGKSAIVVVGTSNMRGRDTETQNCLADIGRSAGFLVPGIGIRNLDRDKRMLPAGNRINLDSQIQQRMHQEFVLGFFKPE